MIVQAKDEEAYRELITFPLALPLVNLQVDIDEDCITEADLKRLCVCSFL